MTIWSNILAVLLIISFVKKSTVDAFSLVDPTVKVGHIENANQIKSIHSFYLLFTKSLSF